MLEGGSGDWPLALKRSIGQVLKDEEDLELVAEQLDDLLEVASAMTPAARVPAAARPFVDFGRLLRDARLSRRHRTDDRLSQGDRAARPALVPRHLLGRAARRFAPPPERLGEFDALFDAMFRDEVSGIIVPADGDGDEDAGRRVGSPASWSRSPPSGQTNPAPRPTGPRRCR